MSPSEQKSSDLLSLCGKVRDGEITPAEFAKLEAWLLKDPQALDTYRRFMAICSGLEQTAVVRQTAGERNQLVTEIDSAAEPKLPRKRRSAKSKQPPRRVRHREISVAVAALATVAAVVVFALLKFDNSGSIDAGSFATVAATHQPVWGDERTLQANESAAEGEYSLASGAVQLNYANGAELLVQAPASFTLHDEKRMTLKSGVASLYIPPAATGFRIDTPFGSAIDHGTRIGVVADTETGIELHVFEGEAELLAPGASAGTMLAANEAASIETDSQQTTSIDADQSYFAKTLNDLGELPTVTGDVELRISPPRSVRRVRAELVDVGRATVFAERINVEVQEELRVTLVGPGKATKVAANKARISAGERVDSYLVHFVLPRDRWRDDGTMTASGQITFNRPIAAVVSHRPNRLNDDFGHPSTDYPGDKLTGLEDAIDDDATQADQIEISEDQKTLTFRLQIHGSGHAEQVDRVDQLRVLVSSTAADR